ncbi:proline--tRNA ligase [Candidatus Dependentiae bacterium]|nr:proline--tRNA ligase [Candidatus Dependentiae bacterium]
MKVLSMANKLPDIKANFPEWYNEIIFQSELADLSPVRGSIVIRPYGYAIWENIQKTLDKKIKDTGHQNAYFPLLIPESFLKKEAKHVEGFAPEVAVVTYAGGKELEEPLVIRPTSETMIHYMFAKWLKSWRDLPFKINQWANIVRWEMRTRPFLRTTEILWQEGHTAHETLQEAQEEVFTMLDQYVDLVQNYLAIPVVAGQKSESEKFAGADKTFTIEGLMQDGRALQMGTSHLISQSFAKSFDMKFQNREGQLAYPYLTSWGVTTRLVGALVMTHGDQKGLIIPPKIAPIQIAIVPIFKGEEKDKLQKVAQELAQKLKTKFRVFLDDSQEETPGAKFYKWELKGVPLRIEIGPRDLQANQVVITDRLTSTKQSVAFNNLENFVEQTLEKIQQDMFDSAKARRDSMWHKVAKLTDFAKQLDEQGGFYQTGWCGRSECEARLKEYKATIRCLVNENNFKSCFNCDLPSNRDILVAKAY